MNNYNLEELKQQLWDATDYGRQFFEDEFSSEIARNRGSVKGFAIRSNDDTGSCHIHQKGNNPYTLTDFGGKLTSIPTGLFDKNVNVTNFGGCFYNCSNLTSIPAGLFDKNVNVTSFNNAFYSCSNLTSIPAGLFDKNVNATDFRNCFYDCYSLTNRPKPHGLEMWQIAGTNGRPTNISIKGVFKNCHTMPDYNSLPNDVK